LKNAGGRAFSKLAGFNEALQCVKMIYTFVPGSLPPEAKPKS
jgi:hypothetical protein